jgi:hypothetical protein
VKTTTSFKDKIEIIANILIVLALLLIGGNYVKSYVARRNAALSPGDKISAPHGYDWHNHDQTLVVAVRQGCAYCERSYPLYRRLEGLEHDNHLKPHMLIRTSILTRVMTMTGTALLIGMAGAFAARNTIQAVLYGVQPQLSAILLFAVFLLGGVAFTASYIPALRSKFIDPAELLRNE